MKIGEDQGEKRNQEEGTSDTGSETTPATAIVTSLSQEIVSTSQVNLNYALISNGKYTSCFDGKAENRSLSCWECTRLFHALCLKEDGETEKLGKDIICSSTFYDSFVKASKKEGVYATRRGNFTFVCDACKVDKGKTSAAAKSDKFTLLDNKIDAVNNSLLLELKELKRMLKTPEKTDTVTPQSATFLNTDYNVWNDKQRTKNLAQIVTVHKDKEGKPISSEKLEKICVENGVSVNRTFHLKKSDTTGMVLNSQHDVDVLTASLKHAHHPVVKISTRVPTVHIVGLSKEYTKEELKAMIVKQNHGISTLFECASTSSEDKLIDILAVKPLKNNSLIFKAIVKVSNVIRSILAIQKNKVYIGYQSMIVSLFFGVISVRDMGIIATNVKMINSVVFAVVIMKQNLVIKVLMIKISSVVTVSKLIMTRQIITLEILGVLYLLNIRTELKEQFLFIKAIDWIQ